MVPGSNRRSRRRALMLVASCSAVGLSFALAGAYPSAYPTTVARSAAMDKYGRKMDVDAPVAYLTAEERDEAPPPADGGNEGGSVWSHPWLEELSKSSLGDDMTMDDVVEFFKKCHEDEGMDPIEEGTTMVILEGIVNNAENAGQGANKAERIAHGISTSAWLMTELTEM